MSANLATRTRKAKTLNPAMLEAIERSGYLFEQTLVPVITRRGYLVTPNHRFVVPGEPVARELDLFAIAGKAINNKYKDWLWPVLLIECKNLEAPMIVFTHREIRSRHFVSRIHFSGLPQHIEVNRQREELGAFLDCDRWHHYYRGARVGRQFCIVAEKSSRGQPPGKPPAALTAVDYVAGHKAGEMDVYRALEGQTAAVHAERLVHARSYIPGPPKSERINIQMYYPIFVTSGALYECHLGAGRPRYQRVHRIGLLLSRAEGDNVIEHRLDVVDSQGLPDLLGAIARDQAKMLDAMQQNLRALTRSVHRLASKLVRLSQAKRVALLME